jgi:hypothetical protein
MALFDAGTGLSSIATAAKSVGSAAGQALGAFGSVAGTVSRVAGALNNLSNPGALISSLRSINLPVGGNIASQIASAGAQFVSADANNDWRVRLSIPTISSFSSSPVLQPLVQAGGLVFPFTPTMRIASTASYDDTPITHQNYQFLAYQYSRVDSITIGGPFHVEDAVQAQYWLGVVHYLRSVTKMFTGDDASAGNPPPIVLLNGYGDYVFKNIPVVVKSFDIELPQDANYISTTAGSGAVSGYGGGTGGGISLAGISSTAGQLAGIAGAIGSAKAAQTLGAISAASGVINGVSSLLGGGTSGVFGSVTSGPSHVPTKSTISVTVQPVYSRESVRNFNLQTFVQGGYLNNNVGYL